VITKDMRVADVGACFGAHTATLLSLARKVVAFEPDPRAYWYLRKNFPNLEIVKAAVGMCCGETEFYLSKRIGTSSLKEKLKNHIQVRVVSLKDYGHFDFVKIDTEGCDIDVLKGLDKSKKARFTIEFAPKQFEDPQQFLDELKTLYVDYFYITPPELP
jgi:FkbM family methyltransferase